MKYAVNCSILFAELPLLERPAAVRAAGFDAVEFWWPWSVAVPSEAEIDSFVSAIEEAGVRLIGLNFFAGDLARGDRGLVSWAARREEFRANVPVAVRIGRLLGCRAFNALYGNRQPGSDSQSQDDEAMANLAFAADAVAEIGGVVLVEPLSGVAAYPLKTSADVAAVIDRVRTAYGTENIRFLCDLYHLASNGDDVAAVCRERAADVGHCQIADVPGRGEPGTGVLPFADLFASLHAGGYDGWVSLEYNPTVPSAQSFRDVPPLP